jgi:hypothetical protein
MPIYDFKSQEIIIKIKRRAQDGGGRVRRGSIPADELLPYPARRTIDDNQIYLNLFDGGETAGETDPGFVFNANPALIVNPISNAYALDASYNYASAFNAFMLGFDFDNFAAEFREIANPWDYGFSINEVSNDDKTDDGFPVNPAAGIQVVGGRAVQYFDTADTAHYKTTAINNPAAAAVPFVLDKSCNVYLMPLVMRWTGRADRWEFPRSFSYPRFDYLLNGFYKAIPRSVLSLPSFESQFLLPFFRFAASPSPAAMPLYPIAVRNDWKLLNCLDPDSSLIEVRYNGAFNYRNWESDTVKDPLDFPTNETSDKYVNPGGSGANQTFRPYAWIYDNVMPANLLCAVIDKENDDDGFDRFYVWSKVETSLYSQSGYLIAT